MDSFPFIRPLFNYDGSDELLTEKWGLVKRLVVVKRLMRKSLTSENDKWVDPLFLCTLFQILLWKNKSNNNGILNSDSGTGIPILLWYFWFWLSSQIDSPNLVIIYIRKAQSTLRKQYFNKKNGKNSTKTIANT